VSPFNCKGFPVTQAPLKKVAALELVQQFGISLRNAYRHLRNGTKPGPVTKVKADGKTYHFAAPNPSKKTDKDLHLARQALNRVINRGVVVTELESQVLVEIFGMVNSLLARKEAA
jgi:hypothetical protein